jgi:uncharacterized protein YbjT (DUF2867 family)
MKTAFIAGASGLVGRALLNRLLVAPDYRQVTIMVRHSLPEHHDKLVQVVDPMTNEDSFVNSVQGDDIFCCLGTTQKKAGSQLAFRRVDYDLPMALAKAAKHNQAGHFIVISAMGASRNSFSFYSRVKGTLEQDLGNLRLNRLSIVRPSLLLGNRPEKRLLEDIGKQVSAIISPLIPANYRPIKADDVAAAMLAIARSTGETATYESGELLELAKNQ